VKKGCQKIDNAFITVIIILILTSDRKKYARLVLSIGSSLQSLQVREIKTGRKMVWHGEKLKFKRLERV